MALGGVSYSSVIVDATGNHSHPVSSPLFLFQMPDCEGPGAPAQQAVRDPQRSVPRPAGGRGPGCSHTRSCPVLLGPHRQGSEAAGSDVPVGSGAEPVARSRPLSTPPSHFPQPPGPVPVPLAGAPSTGWVDRCPGKAEPSCFDVLFTCRKTRRGLVYRCVNLIVVYAV